MPSHAHPTRRVKVPANPTRQEPMLTETPTEPAPDPEPEPDNGDDNGDE